jgi:hypothetical protein
MFGKYVSMQGKRGGGGANSAGMPPNQKQRGTNIFLNIEHIWIGEVRLPKHAHNREITMLSLATLGNVTQTEIILSVLHQPRKLSLVG